MILYRSGIDSINISYNNIYDTILHIGALSYINANLPAAAAAAAILCLTATCVPSSSEQQE